MASHPYTSLPERSFWRSAVAERDPLDIADLWTPKWPIGQDAPVITAGSCFAGHIGRALLEEGMHWYDAEPPPPGLTAEQRSARGYRRFSFRTGNIYTAAALRQWIAWALGSRMPPGEVWEEDGRFYDPYRPTVEPEGFASPGELLRSREVTLAALRTALAEAEVFVFTLGLTEAWHDTERDTVLPMCPGTVRGSFDAGRYVLRNHTVSQVHEDLTEALAMARGVNPGLRTVLTVSPVPLTATATGRHALVATTFSKSVLRAAAGQLADEDDRVDYFPSYEIVTGLPGLPVLPAPSGDRDPSGTSGTSGASASGGRRGFFEANLRTVRPEGVAFVMGHFFRALRDEPARTPHTPPQPPPTAGGEDHSCDDALLDYYGPRPVPPAR
ncbi:GSCFA domain-containing protein [Streptomyces sp. NPDC086077]|uniref:GSCFA domain-containing protein n=1 Tax=Streptomyces sp. NPDC086077 TaxID=3154862 RepID=UPI003428D42E